KRQRANLIPGNAWDKKHRKELKLNCWWWTLPLGNMQEIYEGCEKGRDNRDVAKEELKDEKFLDEWWEGLPVKNKEFIVKNCDGTYRAEDEEDHKKQIDKCLQEQIKEEKLELEKVRGK
ncbi:unnamed protein product, partial [marine sediment metagenome]